MDIWWVIGFCVVAFFLGAGLITWVSLAASRPLHDKDIRRAIQTQLSDAPRAKRKKVAKPNDEIEELRQIAYRSIDAVILKRFTISGDDVELKSVPPALQVVDDDDRVTRVDERAVKG